MRRRRLVVVAALLGAGVIGAASWQAGTQGARVEKRRLAKAWTLPLPGVVTIVQTAVEPGGPEVLVLGSPSSVVLADADGRVLRRKELPSSAIATGDLDGDGADEIVAASAASPLRLTALNGRLEAVWTSPVPSATPPVRVLPVDFDGDGRRELVVADNQGKVVGLDSSGRTRWTYAFAKNQGGEADAVRGLDDVRKGKERLAALARRSGEVLLLDGNGRKLWDQVIPGGIRRLRTANVDADEDTEILLAGDEGAFTRVEPDGAAESVVLGQTLVEIRRLEWDGRPETREVVVGGKHGGVFVLGGGSAQQILHSYTVSQRIPDLGGVDVTGDGRDEILVGLETGWVIPLVEGRDVPAENLGGRIERIVSVVSPLRDRLAVVAAGPAVTALRLTRRTAPAWYSPLTAGALGGAVVVLVTLLLLRASGSGAPAAPAAAVRAESLEAALAQVESLVVEGVVTRAQAAERLQQLERQLREAQSPAPSSASASPPPPPRKA